MPSQAVEETRNIETKLNNYDMITDDYGPSQWVELKCMPMKGNRTYRLDGSKTWF